MFEASFRTPLVGAAFGLVTLNQIQVEYAITQEDGDNNAWMNIQQLQ